MQIINSKDEKEIKVKPEMLNLLGNQDNLNTLKNMNYKVSEKQ